MIWMFVSPISNMLQDRDRGGVDPAADYNHKSFASMEILKIYCIAHQMTEELCVSMLVTIQLLGCQCLSMVSGKHQMQIQRFVLAKGRDAASLVHVCLI